MNTVMKKVVFALLLGLTSQAQAQIIDTTGTDFNYADLTWTSSFQYFSGPGGDPLLAADGTINTNLDAFNGELEIVGSDNGTGVYSEVAMYSTTGATGGVLDFSWAFTNTDTLAGFDIFFWINEGTGTVTRELTEFASSGLESMVVGANALFGLSIDTRDNTGGPAFVDISGMTWTADGGQVGAMPVPAALWLFGTAIAGLGFMRKKKDLKVAI
jgi:hypothetical protein